MTPFPFRSQERQIIIVTIGHDSCPVLIATTNSWPDLLAGFVQNMLFTYKLLCAVINKMLSQFILYSFQNCFPNLEENDSGLV